VPALRGITLDLVAGRVLGLVGQNGAGKSTLMNVLGGVVRPDAGQMELFGQAYAPRRPADAKAAGIAFVHQELNLFGNLSIAENIFVADFPRRRGAIDWRSTRAHAARLLQAVGLTLPPETLVELLSPGERQLVEVAKALAEEPRLVIFDEPTTSLTARETGQLFDLIGRLKASGTTIIYISHTLADVRALADDIAVLREGHLVASGPVAEFDIGRMIKAMIGRDIDALFPPRHALQPGPVLLEARGLSRRGAVDNASLSVRAGEIVGVFGLMGSGRTELARLIFGLDPLDAGQLVLPDGRERARLTPRTAIAAGIAFVTEDRRQEGLLMSASISDNLVLASLRAFSATPGLIDEEAASRAAHDIAARLSIEARDIAVQPAKTLSGGNQQRVVLGKWLMIEPRVIILDEPTRGIDIGARYSIYEMIDRLASAGRGLLLISSEIEEVMAMSDRLLVMSRGEIVAGFARQEFDREAILRAAFREREAA
jgi:ribose transport system ATP-binding protein